MINAAIYFCRGKWKECFISLVCALPFLGSLVAENNGMRKIVSKVEKLTEGVNIGRLEVRAAVKAEELSQLEKS